MFFFSILSTVIISTQSLNKFHINNLYGPHREISSHSLHALIKKDQGPAFSQFDPRVWSIRTIQLFCSSGFKCSASKFTCNNGECVKKNLLCDGDFACKDGSDEDNCECPSSMFNCKEGGCLLATAVCDGTNDCSNGDDEGNCRKLLFFISYFNQQTLI